MVPGAGIEPARCCHRGILSPLRLPISPPGLWGATTFSKLYAYTKNGGASRSRTGLRGFAIQCITALLSRLSLDNFLAL